MKGPVDVHPSLMHQGVAAIAEVSTTIGACAQYDFLQPLFCIDLPINLLAPELFF